MSALSRLLLAVAITSQGVRAETPPPAPSSDWKVLSQLPAGRCLAILTGDQEQRKVRLVRWSEDVLQVEAGRGEQISYTRERLLQVGEYKHCGSAKAALLGGILGFTVGFGAMAVGTRSLCTDCSPGESGLLGAVAVGAAVGVVAAIVSARSTDQPVRWLYRSSP